MGKGAVLWHLAKILLKPILFLCITILGLAYLAMPWAVPLLGRQTLSGEWVGRVRTSHGPKARLILSLQPGRSLAPLWTYVFSSSRYNSPPGAKLDGRAILCVEPTGRVEFNLRGQTRSRRGDVLELLLDPVHARPPELRLDLEGRWDGNNLHLSQRGVSLALVLGLREPGWSEGSGIPERWIEVTMTKGKDALESGCPGSR